MIRTFVGVFSNQNQASKAASALMSSGFGREAMRLRSTASGASSVPASPVLPEPGAAEAPGQAPRPPSLADDVRHLFDKMFGQDEAGADDYGDLLRQGTSLLTIEAEASRAHDVREALTKAGAIQVDEQVSTYGSQDVAGADTPIARDSRAPGGPPGRPPPG